MFVFGQYCLICIRNSWDFIATAHRGCELQPSSTAIWNWFVNIWANGQEVFHSDLFARRLKLLIVPSWVNKLNGFNSFLLGMFALSYWPSNFTRSRWIFIRLIGSIIWHLLCVMWVCYDIADKFEMTFAMNFDHFVCKFTFNIRRTRDIVFIEFFNTFTWYIHSSRTIHTMTT